MNKKVIMYAGLFLLWTFTQTANAQGLKFRVVSFGEDPFDLAARSEQYQEVDGSGSLYAIIKVTSETPDDDVSAYQYNFGMMNHKVKEHNGEVWVYVQKNAKTVTLSRSGYQTISRYDLGTTIEAGKTYKMVLSAQTASVQHCILQFSVDPPGENAIVKVKREGEDGDYDLWGTVDATGGLAKRLEVGTYLYEIVAEHYDRTEGRIPLNGSESKHVERVTLTSNFGYLVVDDAKGITGADIYVNDRKIGTVPYTSKERWDVRDDYRIMVSKGDMYKTYSSTFAIRKGETTKIIPVLEADFAQITLQVANNAEIWIEDEKKGTGKWSGPLRAGIYNVECRLDRHCTTRRAITVTANQSETFTLDAPTPITGSIYVNSNPLGATITLDGKDYGETPNEIPNVLIGQHMLTLSKPTFNAEKKVIDVKEGETTELEVTMSEAHIISALSNNQKNKPKKKDKKAQHELSELKIYVLLLPNGDAVVEEDRTMYIADQGTEVYEKMNGLKDREMRISDFGVSDSIYGDYQLVGWDVNQSRAWKAGRCGINSTEEGIELCWGFGEPGEHTFTTSYVLHNLVQSYTDYDGFNHCFYDAANPPAEYVQLALWASDTTIVLSPENAGLWHFKYYGDAWFSESGKVLLKSTQALDNGDKVVLMMQFNKGLFSPEVKHDETFESRVKERAFINSDYTIRPRRRL